MKNTVTINESVLPIESIVATNRTGKRSVAVSATDPNGTYIKVAMSHSEDGEQYTLQLTREAAAEFVGAVSEALSNGRL